MKIIVLVKQVPDTWGERKLDLATGWVDRGASEVVIDEIGERALEVALSYQDSNDAEVVVLTMGPSGVADAARKALAMGADSAIVVEDGALAGADVVTTSAVLAAAIARAGFDLVITGNESTDGRGGVIPAMIAERLSVPQLTSLNTAEITGSSVRGERATEFASLTVSTSLPAIISVTERSPDARFANFKGIMRAKKKPLETLTLADLGLEAAVQGGHSVIVEARQRPARVAGTKVVDDGTAASALADFLAAEKLI